MDKATKKEFANLAVMVKRGFDAVGTEISEIKSEVSGVKSDISDIKSGTSYLKIKIAEHDHRFDILEKKIDQSWTIMDGYVKSQEDFREEFKIMKHKMTKIEKVIKLKLGVEIE